MYDDVLLPVAPDSDASRAIPHAAHIGERDGATVHVLSVADTVVETLTGPEVGSLADRIESAARDRVHEVEADLDERGIETRTHVVRGRPEEVISEVIEDEGIDIVVMPSHTRTGVQHFLLGSVAERVVRHAPVPVTTVPMNDRDAAADA
ncbi:universal stress protein [Haloparvum sedimenti]|uniref:universal stress protein n=1 Tax=Haloparvum sedimenti TaxID=1678448 RepID=UPI00071E9D98|nr:universal stress protein [Haloparvum sedimenti]